VRNDELGAIVDSARGVVHREHNNIGINIGININTINID
jgi:hypothetical protein